MTNLNMHMQTRKLSDFINNLWTHSDIINEENGSAHQTTAQYLYGYELYLYNTIVMSSETHRRLLFANDNLSDDSNEDVNLHTDRFKTFSDDLAALFQKEVADQYHLHKTQCILHVDLIDNNMTAVVSIQHYTDYHFIVKDHKIALKD